MKFSFSTVEKISLFNALAGFRHEHVSGVLDVLLCLRQIRIDKSSSCLIILLSSDHKILCVFLFHDFSVSESVNY